MPSLDDDLDRIMAVMQAAFSPEYGEAWNRRQVGDGLCVAGTRYTLIFPSGAIGASAEEPPAGFALTRSLFEEEELLLFAVAPEYRRRGLGRALLDHLVWDARSRGIARIFLEMRRDNPAGALYAAQGFRVIGIRPRYYRTPCGQHLDAVTQELLIGRP